MQPNEGGSPPQGLNGQPQNGQPNQNFSQPKGEEQPVQNMQEPQEEQPLQQKQQTDKSQQSNLERPFEEESLKKKLYECNGTACPKSIKQFEGWVNRKLKVLKAKRPAHEGVGLLFGLPTIEREGKRIKGTLAYAGVSLNNRVYLPEELAKGHGRTLPLLLNHSNTAGAEEELDRLDEEMRDHLANGKDYQVGWVTLRWEPEELTLYYEGIIEHEFFQKEVDDANMAVSLGIWYDADSPKVCDKECYTVIRGAEFREVSLVYHPGFPIATIEAVEVAIRQKAKQQIASENWRDNKIFDYNGKVNSLTDVSYITFTDGTTSQFSSQKLTTNAFEGRDYRLQPTMSTPSTTGNLFIPTNPEIVKPEDSMKEKKKGEEDSKKKLLKNSKKKSTQETKQGNSRVKVVRK